MIRQNLAQFSKMCFEVISVKNVQLYGIDINMRTLRYAAFQALEFMQRRFEDAEGDDKSAYYDQVCSVNRTVREFMSSI